MVTHFSWNSLTNPIKGMVDCGPSLSAMNSSLVVLKASSDFNFKGQALGHPGNVIT